MFFKMKNKTERNDKCNNEMWLRNLLGRSMCLHMCILDQEVKRRRTGRRGREWEKKGIKTNYVQIQIPYDGYEKYV